MRRGRGPEALAKSPSMGVKQNSASRIRGTNKVCSSLNGAEIGDAMKTRCDYCCAPFGLLRRRYFNYQFCCEACEEAYKEQRSKMIAEFRSGLSHSLANNT
jgi:hypothetical protein